MPSFLESSSVRASSPFAGQGPDRSQCGGASQRAEDPRPPLEAPVRSAEPSSFSMSGFG